MQTILKVGGCLLIPIVVVVLIAIGGGVYWWTQRGGGDIVGVGLTTSTFMQSLRDKKWDEAHAQLSSSLQKSMSPAALGEAWQRYEAVHGALQPAPDPDGQVRPESRTFLTFDSTAITFSEAGGVRTATFPAKLYFANGPQDITMRMVNENGNWKLAELPFAQ